MDGSEKPEMPPSDEIVSEEIALLAKVVETLSHQTRGGAALVAGDIDRDMIEIRDAMATAKPEDLAPLVEQMTRLAALRGKVGGSQTVPVDPMSPYFAHMRLDDDLGERDILIGTRGFIDRKAGVQIVDWRNSPVSQIYYRYEEGDEYEEEIAGRFRHGFVRVKRNISIHNGKLRLIGCPEGNWVCNAKGEWQFVSRQVSSLEGGQGVAIRVRNPTSMKAKAQLGAGTQATATARKQLPQIAALLDRAQYELISDPHQGLLVIQGGAGSGKTTVALHRMAYLAFANKQRFQPQRMMFVVPSIALRNYTQMLLPSLGVSGVKSVVFRDWAKSARRKVFPNSTFRVREDSTSTIVALKKHPGMLNAIDEYVARQTDECGEKFAEIRSDKIDALWRSGSNTPLVLRLEGVQRQLKRADVDTNTKVIAESVVKQLLRHARDCVTDWSELLSDTALVKKHLGDDVLDSTIESVALRTANQMDSMIDADEHEVDKEVLDLAGFDPEDDPILLRLAQIKWGRLESPNGKVIDFAHIAVDESQDRAAIDIAVLAKAVREEDEQRSITIAGDTAQQLVFDNKFSGWKTLVEELGVSPRYRELSISYRSTKQIMKFANALLEVPPDVVGTPRDGKPVAHFPMSEDGEVVSFLSGELRDLVRREPNASIAVLTRFPEAADRYYNGLKRAELPRLRRAQRDEFVFEPGIDVATIAGVKGLEYDYVIIVRVNAEEYPNTQEARHLLHVGATRAAHQLWIFTSGQVPNIAQHAFDALSD